MALLREYGPLYVRHADALRRGDLPPEEKAAALVERAHVYRELDEYPAMVRSLREAVDTAVREEALVLPRHQRMANEQVASGFGIDLSAENRASSLERKTVE